MLILIFFFFFFFFFFFCWDIWILILNHLSFYQCIFWEMSLSSLGHHNSQSDPAPRPPTHSTVTFIRLHLLILSGSKSIFYPQIFFFFLKVVNMHGSVVYTTWLYLLPWRERVEHMLSYLAHKSKHQCLQICLKPSSGDFVTQDACIGYDLPPCH